MTENRTEEKGYASKPSEKLAADYRTHSGETIVVLKCSPFLHEKSYSHRPQILVLEFIKMGWLMKSHLLQTAVQEKWN